MRTIGVVGGIGPESTIDYYRRILATARERGLAGAPSVLIHSIDVARLLALAGADDHAELVEYLLASVEVLARGGAELALFASNTPHLVFDAVAARSPIPLVSIVTATCDVSEQMGLTRLGLIGTQFTMQGGFYQVLFARRGLSVVTPAPDDRAYVHDKYVNELVPGTFSAETRDGVCRVLDRLRAEQAIDAVILGGTELPLLLRGVEYPVSLLDTTQIHVSAAVAQAAR